MSFSKLGSTDVDEMLKAEIFGFLVYPLDPKKNWNHIKLFSGLLFGFYIVLLLKTINEILGGKSR